jgi:hypothetical protein
VTWNWKTIWPLFSSRSTKSPCKYQRKGHPGYHMLWFSLTRLLNIFPPSFPERSTQPHWGMLVVRVFISQISSTH